MALRMVKHGILLAAMATMTLARPVVVESLPDTPAGWDEISSPAPDKLIKLSIGLRAEDHQLFERTLYEASDPSHANYGKHLSCEAANALLNPPQVATDTVKRWLSDSGIADDKVQDDGQWVHIRATVSQAEELLSTRFGVFTRDDEEVVRTREYSVPGEIRDHITTIQPTTFFHSVKKSRSAKRSSQDLINTGLKEERSYEVGGGYSAPVDANKCQDEVTPACIRKLYKMPAKGYSKAHPKALYGIAGFGGQTAQYDELEEFLRRFDPIQQGRNFSVSSVNGGQNPQGEYPSGEANLNIQWSLALAGQVPVRFFSVGGENHDFKTDLDIYSNTETFIEPWLELSSYLVNLEDKKLPQVISISYGDNEQHLHKTYAKKVCDQFGILGARGVSVIVAGGNLGPGASCMSNDGKNTTKFLPGFPATCPYVTSVGGTDNYNEEVANTFSGGGFSEYWSRPSWQDDAVKAYLKKLGNKWKGYYNPNGRAYPDVAALAWGYQIINHDNQETTGGTSAASPVFGSMIALINSERLKKGKPPLGFLNPWIYKIKQSGFTDITEGKSEGCKGTSVWGLPSPVIPNAGWKAVKGWDPITGWGTPLFDKLWKLGT
ncbi:putative tripeptidyl-peptidase SED2 [Neonectria ditissima]|uniref:tripeptidyl-peptidase II n=1 Tax=Neonectria ditissima TaxID=78410 RepID=A0A0P7AKW5_9HYPO|nr:putative tripeptidyl-peptidase SED2 [Neonectria ditissima]